MKRQRNVQAAAVATTVYDEKGANKQVKKKLLKWARESPLESL